MIQVSNTALSANNIYLALYAGFGLDLRAIVVRYGIEVTYVLSKGTLIMVITWQITACLSKISVLLMYATIIPNGSMLKISRYLGAIIAIWTGADLIAVFSICRPFELAWTSPSKCHDQPLLYFIMGLLNLLIDAVIIALPMPYLFRLRMSWRRKLVAVILLRMGIVYVRETDFHRLQYADTNPRTWGITIYRQKIMWRLEWTKYERYPDMVFAMILSGLETAVMIVVACIPLMRPLFSRSKTRRPPNVRYYENNLNAGTHLGKREKKAAAKLPRLLHPPSWFDNKDVDAQVELQTEMLVQVPVAEPTSTHHRSGVPEATVVD